jgi:V/A-type H+-transporting ATPase subunit I
MAIVKMQKLSICANKRHRKAILETMQNMGIMELSMTDLLDDDLQTMDTQTARSKYEKRAASFDQAIRLLKTYAPEKGGGAGLFAEKREVDRKRMADAEANRHHYNVEAADIQQAEKKINECTGIILKDENMKQTLAPWLALDIPMSTTGTKKTAILIGTMPGGVTSEAELYALATRDIPENAPVTADILSTGNEQTCVSVICLKRDLEKVEENLRSAGFARPSQPVIGIPADEIRKLDEDVATQKAAIREAEQRIAAYASDRENFEIMSDYYRIRADKYEMLGKLPQSRNAFFMEGWVPEEQADRISELLSRQFGALVERETKKPDEMEPTILRNNAFSEAAEGVLASYGLPQHGRFDPTGIMSVFYVFFFGMMLSDGGYGLVMALATGIILLRHKNLEDGMKRFMKLFFFCGLSTTFWGFMYGGFFGDAIDVIAHTWFNVPADQVVLKPIWFAPLNDPMRLLIWCLLFGVIHLYFGLGIKGYEALRDGDFVGFFSDIVSWYLFLTGLIFMLLPSDLFRGISGMEFDFPSWVGPAAQGCVIAGAVIILLMSGRKNKNFIIRIALGAYDIYGVTSWLSDVLSYSRLLALGLATGVIASVINMMGSMFGSGPLKVILFAVIFVLGHTLNIAINALGAYVHTNRLQYVEFFGKFYDAGGKPFVPFRSSTKYIHVKEEK